jgi:putative membrane protein
MSVKRYLTIATKGLLMGAADVVPGVSGGTIAFITGIYEELIKTIDGIDFQLFKDLFKIGFKKTLAKYNLGFLLALLTGIAISLLSLSKLLIYLLQHHSVLLWSFFFGLVMASVLYIAKQISSWNTGVITAIIIGTVISYYVTIAEPLGSPDSWWYLIFSGFIAIIAMILPGVSGAFLLLLLGSYKTVLGSISGLLEAVIAGEWSQAFDYFINLFLFVIGCILGLKVFSRLLTWLFEHQKNLTLALLTGFMIGSLNKLWPWKEVLKYRIDSHGEKVPFLEKSISPVSFEGDPQILYVISLTLIGFVMILALEKWSNKKTA